MKSIIRDLRGERGWSQATLAKELGVSRQTIIALENEKYDPSLRLAFGMLVVFGKPIEDIFQPNN